MRRILPVLLALLLALSGCGADQAAEGPLLYYVTVEGDNYSLSALQSQVWADAPETPDPSDYVAALLEAPEDGGLYSVLPSGLELLSWSLEDGLLSLDLSEEYGALTGITLTLANACLVLTLTQLDGVEALTVTVEGRALPEGSGTPLTAEDLLLTGGSADPVTVGFQLYFPLTGGSGLGTEYREAELTATGLTDQIAAVILLLTQGPQRTDEMSSPFSELESQLECEMVDEVCLLTLTEGWAQVLSADEQALQALVNSLCELEGVDALAFTGADAGLTGEYYADYD